MTDSHSLDLQQLCDERDIIAVALRYCRALDTKDWALLDDVFIPDATADLASPTELVGIPAIVERIDAALGYLDVSQHLVGNHEVEIDGDTATHSCYLQAQHVLHAAGTEGASPNYIVAGTYADRFVRTEAGWRIAHRTLTVTWRDGNLAVVHHP